MPSTPNGRTPAGSETFTVTLSEDDVAYLKGQRARGNLNVVTRKLYEALPAGA